jgi:hypothetical protein
MRSRRPRAGPFGPAALPGAALAAALALAAGSALAGPGEARALWKHAQALPRASPFRERLAAWRSVRAEAALTDPLHVRAAVAEARALRGGGHVPAAQALEAHAAALGPRRDPDRLSRALAAAREWVEEGDDAGARALLGDVLDHAGADAAGLAAGALDVLSRLAHEAGDLAALAAVARRGEALVPGRLGTRLRLLDRWGLLLLARGDVAGARRVAADERRLYAEAERRGGEIADDAAKAWLSLRLPERAADDG